MPPSARDACRLSSSLPALARALLATITAVSLDCARALPNGLGQLPGLGWNSDYCTNCTGPASAVPLPARLGGGLQGLKAHSRGFGGEDFVKHIADHMHTHKYSAGADGSGPTKPSTLQELGFHCKC